jgi:hypothetical protein
VLLVILIPFWWCLFTCDSN